MGAGTLSESDRLHALNSIGIVVALPQESGMLLGHVRATGTPVRLSDRAWLAVSGKVGAESATEVGKRLLEAGANALVSWGSAGALDPDLHAGDLLLPDRIVDMEGREYWPDPQWFKRSQEGLCKKCTVHTGTLLQNASMVSTVEEKCELHKNLRAVAVDMESAAIAHLAQQHKVPFLAVRTIADTAMTSMPRIIRDAIDEEGRVHYSHLVRNACFRPTDLPDLFILARHFFAARKTLQSVADDVDSGLFITPEMACEVEPMAPIPHRNSRMS